jgi:DNA-binding MarR family transcriptional regulator
MSEGLAEAHACLGFALRKAARSITRRYDAALRESGLRSTQFNLLVVLDAVGPVTTTELAKTMAIERTTLTRNLALLEKKRWVTTEPAEDLRSHKIAITERGRRAAGDALSAWRRAQRSLEDSLGKRTFERLVVDLAKLSRVRPIT